MTHHNLTTLQPHITIILKYQYNVQSCCLCVHAAGVGRCRFLVKRAFMC